MIPRPTIVEWGRSLGWPTEAQTEQDLVLSRLIIEIANDPYLGDELVFRGGTCLHKLHTERAYRYSEDLDYVRRTGGGIAPLTQAVTAIGERPSHPREQQRRAFGAQPLVLRCAPDPHPPSPTETLPAECGAKSR